MKSKISKVKANNWIDINTGDILYGIDVLVDGRWLHCSEEDKPLFFDTPELRDARIKELKDGK